LSFFIVVLIYRLRAELLARRLWTLRLAERA